MDLKYFPQFIRKNYPQVADASNEDLMEIGKDFKNYLQSMLDGKEDKLASIWDINPKTVIRNECSRFKVNGYNPALLIHFDDFISLEMANLN